jgi:hypothetical protein
MIHAKSLLVYNRWDITIKYVYIKYFHLYCIHHPEFNGCDSKVLPVELKWFKDLYLDHLRVLNGGYETVNTFQRIEKKTPEKFLDDFHKLYFSIKKNGFDHKYPIPVGYNNTIINGAHRIAISILFNLNIPVIKVNNAYSGLNIPPDAFNDRTKYKMPISNTSMVISGLSKEQQDFVLNEYVQIKNENLRFLVIYDHQKHNQELYLKTYLKSKGYNILHYKDINLNIYGAFQFVKNLYYNEPKVNITLKTAQSYFVNYLNEFPKEFTTRVYLIEGSSFDSLSPSGASDKIYLRYHYKSDNSLHVSDNPDETAQLATLIYHQPSLDYLNLSPFSHHSKINQLFFDYTKVLKKKPDVKENFIIVSSFILGILGIRSPTDLDFIYDHHILKAKNNEKSEYGSHYGIKGYKQYYPDLFTLLYNPRYHFYYFSYKVMTLEEIIKMKLKRREEKDLLDVELINNFIKYSFLRTQLSIITTTHAIPSAPSVKIIETCLKSFYEHFPGLEFVHHWIYFDSREDKVSLEYWDNLLKLKDTYPNLILCKEPHSGLKQNYLKGLKNIITPFFMFLEHDWIFSEKVDIPAIIHEFNNKPNLHYLKFNKRDNYQTGGWDTNLIKDDTIKTFTAIKTNSWTNHPHIVRREKWLNSWLPLVMNPTFNQLKGSFGIEEILYRLYQYEIQQIGFEKAHKKWGCYNYGSKSGKSLVQHIDGSERYDIDTIDGRQIKID